MRKRLLACALTVGLSFGSVISAGAVEGPAGPPGSGPRAVSMAEVASATAGASAVAGLHPADIADAYGLSGGVDGRTVAVVIPYDTPTLEADLAVYRSTFGLPACTTANGCFTKVDQNGGTSYPAFDREWSVEASLDVDSVSAACPGCKILVVEAANHGMTALGTAVNRAVTMGAAAVTMSWGVAENGNASYYSGRYFTHPGVALIAASGDSAYPQASMPAILPGVIAVGGTTLSRTTASGAARQAAAADDALLAANGNVTAAFGLTAAQEHVATLVRAKTDLAAARAKATTATKAVTAAKKAVTTQRRLLARATVKVKAAAEKAKRSDSAATRRALTTAKKSRTARQAAYLRATARVTARTKAVTAANRTVRALTASVSAAQTVVNTDRTLLSAPVSPPTPVPAPVPTPTSTPTAASTPTPSGSPNAPPTASFSRSTSDLTVTLDGSASSDSDGTVVAYTWNFGDGSTGSGRTATHTYAATGTYTITLTVTDDGGSATSASTSVSVTAPPPAALSAARGSWMETAWSGAGSGCSASVGKPAWQTDSACTKRTVADVSAVADPATGLAVYDTSGTVAAGYTADGWMVIGGTSLAAPLIAGMIVRSGHAANYNDAGPLYSNRAAFWDVTSGSNGSCSGSAVCTAGTGYDGPTGLGTPKSLASF